MSVGAMAFSLLLHLHRFVPGSQSTESIAHLDRFSIGHPNFESDVRKCTEGRIDKEDC